MTIFLSLVIGFIVGAAAADHVWRKNFIQAVRNIDAILSPKPAQERKPA
jgi:hypothetical protein